MSNPLEDLVDLALDGYAVRKMTEVYTVDYDGRKTRTIGFFKDGEVAKAWAQNQSDKNFNKTQEVLVITNAKRYFLFEGTEITVEADEQAALEVRQAALAKLSPEERAVLGL